MEGRLNPTETLSLLPFPLKQSDSIHAYARGWSTLCTDTAYTMVEQGRVTAGLGLP